MPRVDTIDIRDRLRWHADDDQFERIRRLWIDHSKAEDARDLDGLVATLTQDCVYEIPWTGHRWEGHDGARRFYTELLGAFSDIHFDLQDIVVGPQGVFEYAEVTGTHTGSWIGLEPDGERKRWQNAIFFPWDPEVGKFAGEKIFGSPTSPAAGGL
jgi:predicted ester cyclase